MRRADDPYKLGWRFWSRYLTWTLVLTTAGSALFAYFFEEPLTFDKVIGWWIFFSLVDLGPELSVHYHKTPAQLAPHQKR